MRPPKRFLEEIDAFLGAKAAACRSRDREHPCCARLYSLGQGQPSVAWGSAVAHDFQRRCLSAGLVTLAEGSSWLLLQAEARSRAPPSAAGDDAVERNMCEALEMLGLRGAGELLRPLHSYYLELFGWVDIPGLRLDCAPDLLQEEPPSFCTTLEAWRAYREQAAYPAWRRPWATPRWLRQPPRLVCDHVSELPADELQAWVELRLAVVSPEQVALPLVVHAVGQLGQAFEPLEVYALAKDVYATYCERRGIAPRPGAVDLQMRAAHEHVLPRCRRCVRPVVLCARRRGDAAACCCEVCGGEMAPNLHFHELRSHSSDVAGRSQARDCLSRLRELLSFEDEVRRFDVREFRRWQTARKSCCLLSSGDASRACPPCLAKFEEQQRLQELKLHPPNWSALHDEKLAASERLSLMPPLVQGAWACLACKARGGGALCEAALTSQQV